MSRILVAWELGAGYGHYENLQSVALGLRERGHEVVFAVRDLSRAEAMLGALGFVVVQAPLGMSPGGRLPPAANYAELLLRAGYHDAGALTGVVRAWRHLFAMVKPQLLLAEHAPTALLAAHGLKLCRVMTGVGFCCPPPASPLPQLLQGPGIPSGRPAQSEAYVLAVINRVLADLRAPALPAVAELFRVDAQFLSTFAELDPFAEHRNAACYRGPRVLATGDGAAPRWPSSGTAKVFGYLNANTPDLQRLLKQLAHSAEAVLLHVPDVPEAFVRKFSSPSLAICVQRVNMQLALAQCDLGLTLAGHGTTLAMLLAGRPMVLIPTQVEQHLTAQRVKTMGAGLMVPTFDSAGKALHGKANLAKLLLRLRTEKTFKVTAAAFAARYADFDSAADTHAIVKQVHALTGAKP